LQHSLISCTNQCRNRILGQQIALRTMRSSQLSTKIVALQKAHHPPAPTGCPSVGLNSSLVAQCSRSSNSTTVQCNTAALRRRDTPEPHPPAPTGRPSVGLNSRPPSRMLNRSRRPGRRTLDMLETNADGNLHASGGGVCLRVVECWTVTRGLTQESGDRARRFDTTHQPSTTGASYS
jgi:hypothetical protein